MKVTEKVEDEKKNRLALYDSTSYKHSLHMISDQQDPVAHLVQSG